MTPLRLTYIAQGCSVGVITLSMGVGYSAYQRGVWIALAFHAGILCVNAGLFLWQGYIRALIRRAG